LARWGYRQDLYNQFVDQFQSLTKIYLYILSSIEYQKRVDMYNPVGILNEGESEKENMLHH
jgi:hypothetical protein